MDKSIVVIAKELTVAIVALRTIAECKEEVSIDSAIKIAKDAIAEMIKIDFEER
jgi:hypothetical protein